MWSLLGACQRLSRLLAQLTRGRLSGGLGGRGCLSARES